MSKPLNGGSDESQAQPKPLYHTRSVTQTATNGKPNSQQSSSRVAPNKEQQNGEISTALVTDVATTAKVKAATMSIMMLQPIVEGLNKILHGKNSTEQVIKGIFTYIRELEKTEKEDKERREIQMEVSALRKAINADVGKLHVTILGLVGPLFFISLAPSFLINPSRLPSF